MQLPLAENWKQTIEEFKNSYKSLEIVSVTPKAHSLFYETVIFIQRKQKPLGFFSESKFEHGIIH